MASPEAQPLAVNDLSADNQNLEHETDSVGWKEFTTSDGKKYETRAKATENRADNSYKELEEPTISPQNSWQVVVNWQAGNHWVDVDDDTIRKTGIKRYWLIEQSWPNIYSYRLRIDCVRSETYYFWDADGGSPYKLWAWQTGEHEVKYNSGNPTIIRIANFT
ncbi:hypothetical protein V8C40DRAFT_234069 [Trichoderma camerunense]